MSDGIMHVVQYTSALCVIRVGGAGMLTYAFLLLIPLYAVLIIGGKYSPWLSSRVAHGWSIWIPALLVCVVLPLFLAGETDVLTLSRDKGTLQISTTKFFLWTSTQNVDLRNVYSAANTGRYNQFQINLTDGNYIWIGNDTTEGGRAESADAMNRWLRQYRGQESFAP